MLPVSRVIGHKEWAPGRKSDPTYDMNWRRACVAGIRPRASASTPKGLFMALTATEEQEILEAARSVLFGQAGVRPAGRMAIAISDLYTAVGGVNQRLDALGADLDALAQRPTGQVDPAPIVAAVVDAVTRAGIAEQVVDALAERLAANPA